MNRTLTAVSGLRVGHARDEEAATGCTVVLGPFRAAAELLGMATGSRELDALSPLHIVPRCDAILLTGGSAFGLAAADGVMAWLEEAGQGFPTRSARVPIVPAAVIYDLSEGRADVRPGPDMGRQAAESASSAPVPEGRVGVGTGATVGKVLGPERAAPGGVGSWADARDGNTVAALAVVNAFGDVLDETGAILAGCRADDGNPLDTTRAIAEARIPLRFPETPARPAESTTLAVVATDVPLARRELQIVARTAAVAVARRISPAGTAFDGDLVFALSTGGAPDGGLRRWGDRTEEPPAPPPLEVLSIGLRARNALERAIGRAVRPSAGGAGPDRAVADGRGGDDRAGDEDGHRGGHGHGGEAP